MTVHPLRRNGSGPVAGVSERNLADQPIITPPDILSKLNEEFHFDFDPCPYPKPEGFDGLDPKQPWGKSNYINPLFGPTGFTPWIRRAFAEQEKGNTSVMTLPVWAWIALMLERADEHRVRRDWRWQTPSGQFKKPSQPLVVWVLRGRKVA